MKRTLILIVILFSCLAWAADTKSLLPKAFSGWQLQSEETTADVSKADPIYASLLKEYGFTQLEKAQYTKPGRNMTVKLARFNDASGAYGAYTFYRSPEMAGEEIGDQAASNNDRALFLHGNLLVDVKFDHLTPMSAGELRELANELPSGTGSSAKLPNVIDYLPKQGMVPNTVKYVSGPAGLARIDSAPPADLVDFGTLAEIASAQYKTGEGTSNLLLIKYPNSAVAGAKLHNLEQWHSAAANGSNDPAKVYTKRIGPMVGVVTGSISEGEAKTLLGSVNYETEVTWNENTYFDKRNNIGSLLVNNFVLIGIIFGLAIVSGVAFGGFRVLMKKWFPDRWFDSRKDDLIRLDIESGKSNR